MTGGKSGQALGTENVERLRAYLNDLAGRGLTLPMRRGEVNMSAIALACGFNRQVLYVNEHAKDLLAKAIETAGLTKGSAQDGEEDDAKPEQRSDRRDRRIHKLEQENAALKAENDGLRRQLKRLEHVESVMMAGRRVAF